MTGLVRLARRDGLASLARRHGLDSLDSLARWDGWVYAG